jgi:hypothetical protein
LRFGVVDSRVNEEVLGNPLRDSDSFRQFEEFRLADFFAPEGLQAKGEKPSLKFPALLQGFIPFRTEYGGDFLTATLTIHGAESFKFWFGHELEIAQSEESGRDTHSVGVGELN